MHQGTCRLFTAGLDLTAMTSGEGDGPSVMSDESDVSRKALQMEGLIETPQLGISAFEKCRKPVIAVVDGACIGGGVDLISACDIRYCTKDAYFCIKEVAVGLAADIGTLQRLPKIIGNDGLLRELAYTARKLPAAEAHRVGLVSRVEATRAEAIAAAHETALEIAKFSPVAVLATKVSLNYSRCVYAGRGWGLCKSGIYVIGERGAHTTVHSQHSHVHLAAFEAAFTLQRRKPGSRGHRTPLLQLTPCAMLLYMCVCVFVCVVHNPTSTSLLPHCIPCVYTV